jgi:hypothetical protein
MELFREAMNSTAHNGIYGKLILSDDVLMENSAITPSQ